LLQVFVNQDTAAVFADHYFFVLFDLALFLRGDRVKTTTAGISFHRHHCQTIAIAFADLLIAVNRAGINMLFSLLQPVC
jgi:hypothetical protein